VGDENVDGGLLLGLPLETLSHEICGKFAEGVHIWNISVRLQKAHDVLVALKTSVLPRCAPVQALINRTPFVSGVGIRSLSRIRIRPCTALISEE